MSAPQRKKFHTDDLNQCLHNLQGVNVNLFEFMFLLVNNGKVLCSSATKKTQMILLKKNIFQKYWSLFCDSFVVFTSINQSLNLFMSICGMGLP